MLPPARYAVTAGLLLAACGGDSAPDEGGMPADVVLVENPAPAAESRLDWTFGDAPELTIGLDAGEDAYQLFGVRDAAILPGGDVAIANAGTEIRVFGPDGTHHRTMGGAGEGPGEFRALRAIEPWAADSVAGWDVRQRRLSVFDAEGNHGRTFRVAEIGDGYAPEFLGTMPDGRLFFRTGFARRSDEPYRGMFRPDQLYVLLDAEGRPSVELGSHLGEETYLSAGGGMETVFRHPHGNRTSAAVWGDRLLISPDDTYELRAFDLEGRLERVVRLEREVPAPTRNDMEAWFEDFTADDTPEERAAFRQTFDAFPLLDAFPAFEGLLVDALDHVWVRDFVRPGDDRTSWVVFDPEGRALGRIETPPGLEVYEIGADYLLGRARNALNVESVQRWALDRSPTPNPR